MLRDSDFYRFKHSQHVLLSSELIIFLTVLTSAYGTIESLIFVIHGSFVLSRVRVVLRLRGYD